MTLSAIWAVVLIWCLPLTRSLTLPRALIMARPMVLISTLALAGTLLLTRALAIVTMTLGLISLFFCHFTCLGIYKDNTKVLICLDDNRIGGLITLLIQTSA